MGPATMEILEIHGEACDRDLFSWPLAVGAIPVRALNDALDSQEQLAQVERLYQIVVGAELKALDAVALRGAGCEHEDGKLLISLSYLAGYLKAVDFLEHQVQNDQIELLARLHRQCLLTASGHAHRIAFLFKIELQGARKISFVLYQQDSCLALRFSFVAHLFSRITLGFRELLLVPRNAQYLRTRGSRTLKVDPRPGPALAAHTLPPWSRTMLRTM